MLIADNKNVIILFLKNHKNFQPSVACDTSHASGCVSITAFLQNAKKKMRTYLLTPESYKLKKLLYIISDIQKSILLILYIISIGMFPHSKYQFQIPLHISSYLEFSVHLSLFCKP